MKRPIPSWASLDEIRAEVRQCAKERPEFKKVENLVLRIFTLQEEVRMKGILRPEDEDLKQSLRQGTALLGDLCLDLEVFARHVEALVNLLDSTGAQVVPAPELVLEFFQAHVDQLVDGLAGAPRAWVKRLHESTGLSPDVAQFLLWAVMHPFFRGAARSIIGDRDTHLWSGSTCPVCAAKPHMGQLRENDGLRVMECWLCAAQWEYPRIRCPFCGNEDQETLGFFHLEGDEGCRVQVCDSCKRYLKVFDARVLDREVVLSVQHLATLGHDAVAREEGYLPGSSLVLVPEIGEMEEVEETTERGENG
jgi:FdhE protein